MGDRGLSNEIQARRDVRPEQLTENLNEAQFKAVTVETSPLRVLAGAGSGKTRVLTHRIAYRSHSNTLDAQRVLAVTFTRKAASELRARLARLGLKSGVTSGTFHSIAYAQLRQRWEERGIRPPELLDRKVGFVSRLMAAKDRSSAMDVVAEIEWASARMVSPEDYERHARAANRTPPMSTGAVAVIYDKFVREKQRRRMVDFDDLLRLAVRDVEADPVYASALHWRFRHLFVDEFQDVNPLQYRLVKAWLGPESDLCAVGDPNQAIYAWNGADARYINDFDSFFPGSTTVVLDRNYRSTPQILTVANAVLADGGATPIKLKSQRRDGPVPRVFSHENATVEAQSIARAARDRHGPGTAWAQQAVLVRTNAQALILVEEFTRAGIPHKVRGSGNLLSQPEIRNALNTIRRSPSLEMALADVEDGVRSMAPAFFSSQIQSATQEQPTTQDQPTAQNRAGGRSGSAEGNQPEPPEQDASTGPSAEPSGPGSAVGGRTQSGQGESTQGEATINDERAANLMELVRLGHEYTQLDPTGGTPGFLGWLISTLQGDDRASGDVVEIMSFHAAKGLEWPVVHLAGLEEGYVPIHHAKDSPAATEEERRLLYVAMTRARDELLCNWSQSRMFGSRTAKRRPSPWVDTILSTTQVASPMLAGQAGRSRARQARRSLKANSDQSGTGGKKASQLSRNERLEQLGGGRPLFEELRKWRKSQADGADVPAFVVFSDETLIEIAKKRPSTKSQLLQVHGIGPVKAERYSDDLLRIVADSG